MRSLFQLTFTLFVCGRLASISDAVTFGDQAAQQALLGVFARDTKMPKYHDAPKPHPMNTSDAQHQIVLLDTSDSPACTADLPCGRGESGCDPSTTATCFPGLQCVPSRDGKTHSCRTEGEQDYCTPSKPCSKGQGACLTDDDCSSSTLQCKFDGHTGYSRCEERGTRQFCTTLAVCKEGEGNCGSDDECDRNLYCDKTRTGTRGTCRRHLDWVYCSRTNKCGEGVGMCVVNSDCKDGLFCDFDLYKETTYGHCNYKLCKVAEKCTQDIGNCQKPSHCESGLKCSKLAHAPTIGVCRAPMTKFYCTPDSQCSNGEGLCLIDHDCAGHGSRCNNGICRTAGSHGYCTKKRKCSNGKGLCYSDDTCVTKCVKDSRNSHSRNTCEEANSKFFCSKDTPCKVGEGHCDSSDECEGTSRCYENKCIAMKHANYCKNEKCAADVGDCDNDSECNAGLRCVQTSGTDYCRAPNTAGYCSTSTKCAQDLGLCKSDGECESGLRCVRFDTHRAYCRKPDTSTYCSTLTPCKVNEGYCSSTAECQSGLRCRSNKCVADSHGDYCTASEKCKAGQGDCDRDDDCETGLRCAQTSGTDYCRAPGEQDYCLPNRRCNANEGRCDSDSACESGLRCGANRCRDRGDEYRCSSPAGKCGSGEGNCRSDSECESDLKCRKQSSSLSQCEKEGTSRYCTTSHQCKVGEGECSSNEECEGSLACNMDLKRCWNAMGMTESRWFSEENGGYSGVTGFPFSAVRCNHDRCDNLQLYMGNSGDCEIDGSKAYWTGSFSEEHNGIKTCNGNDFIFEVRCHGGFCDNKQLQCAPLRGPNCHATDDTISTSYVSSSHRRTGPWCTCPAGYYAYGMRCAGSHCSHVHLYCRKIALKAS